MKYNLGNEDVFEKNKKHEHEIYTCVRRIKDDGKNVGKKWDENWEKGGDVGRNGSPFDFQASRNYPSRTFHIPELEQSDRYDAFSLFLFLLHPPILSSKPPQALVAVAYRENAWKDSGKRLWKGDGGGEGCNAGLRAPKLKEGITVGNGEGLEGRGGVRSVVAIVETIPNGWMRGMGREKENFLFAHVGTGRSTSLKIICFQSWFGRPRLITWGGTRKAFYQSRL